VTVAVVAGKTAHAVRPAAAAAVHALAVAGGVLARAFDVARAGCTSEVARAAALAAAGSVRAGSRTVGSRIAADVTRRTLTGEPARAARAAVTFAVAALPDASRVVARAIDVARRSQARKLAALARRTEALSVVTGRRIVVVATERGQCEHGKRRQKTRDLGHGRRPAKITLGAPGQPARSRAWGAIGGIARGGAVRSRRADRDPSPCAVRRAPRFESRDRRSGAGGRSAHPRCCPRCSCPSARGCRP
jgi:hypothetical protein